VVNYFGFFGIPWGIEIVVFSSAMGILCGILAFYRGRSGFIWCFLGFLFSIFALITVLALPSRRRMKVEPPKICPYCRASNSRAFGFCVSCGKPFKKGLMTVAVHHFQIWNNRIGDWEIPHAKRTANDIAAVNGVIIQDTMEMVRDSELDSHGRYFPRDDVSLKDPPGRTGD
jgi:hypothetical protein